MDRTKLLAGEGKAGDGPAVQTDDLKADCAGVRATMLEFIGNELPEEVARETGEHLRDCASCRTEYLTMVRLMEGLRAADPARAVPGTLSEKGRRRVVWAWTHPFLAWCVLRHRWISLTAVILVFAAVFLALRRWRLIKDPPPPGVSVLIKPEELQKYNRKRGEEEKRNRSRGKTDN